MDTWLPVITLVIGLAASPLISAIGYMFSRRFRKQDENVAYIRQAYTDLYAALYQLQQAFFDYLELPDPFHGDDTLEVTKRLHDAARLIRFHAARIGDPSITDATAVLTGIDRAWWKSNLGVTDIDQIAEVIAVSMTKHWTDGM